MIRLYTEHLTIIVLLIPLSSLSYFFSLVNLSSLYFSQYVIPFFLSVSLSLSPSLLSLLFLAFYFFSRYSLLSLFLSIYIIWSLFIYFPLSLFYFLSLSLFWCNHDFCISYVTIRITMKSLQIFRKKTEEPRILKIICSEIVNVLQKFAFIHWVHSQAKLFLFFNVLQN